MTSLTLSHLIAELAHLEREAHEVLEALVRPNQATRSFHQTLYGYVHRCFAFIDVMSAYWRGNENDQSKRMVDFMASYLGPDRRAHDVAVQIWRHKLVHTALPRDLHDPSTGRIMHYMIRWSDTEMQPHQPHYSIIPHGEHEVFSLACDRMLADLQRAAASFVADLDTSPRLTSNATKFEKKLRQYKLKSS